MHVMGRAEIGGRSVTHLADGEEDLMLIAAGPESRHISGR